MVSNQDVEIAIYKNRVEIYNPGQFPDEYTPEDFINGEGKSVLRNKLIAQTLFLSHEVETFGTGIRRIYEECQKNNVKVEFRQDKLGFTVIFYRKTEEELENIATNKLDKNNSAIGTENGTENSENKTEKIILNLLKLEPQLTQNQISNQTSIPLRTVKRTISKLKEKNIIERVGSDRKGYWKIIE